MAESKRAQITKICNENQERKRKNESLLTYNGIDIGTTYKESYFLMYLKQELRNISEYLSGADNQGKAYATLSFKTGSGEEERWKFEVLDLKYKEYIDALITYDKRADEVLLLLLVLIRLYLVYPRMGSSQSLELTYIIII